MEADVASIPESDVVEEEVVDPKMAQFNSLEEDYARVSLASL